MLRSHPPAAVQRERIVAHVAQLGLDDLAVQIRVIGVGRRLARDGDEIVAEVGRREVQTTRATPHLKAHAVREIWIVRQIQNVTVGILAAIDEASRTTGAVVGHDVIARIEGTGVLADGGVDQRDRGAVAPAGLDRAVR